MAAKVQLHGHTFEDGDKVRIYITPCSHGTNNKLPPSSFEGTLDIKSGSCAIHVYQDVMNTNQGSRLNRDGYRFSYVLAHFKGAIKSTYGVLRIEPWDTRTTGSLRRPRLVITKGAQ